jgi:hypothetical protein
MVPQNNIGLSRYEMLYGFPYLSSVSDIPSFETKDYFLKNYNLGLSFMLLCLQKKGLLAQASPFDFDVHPYHLGDYVLIKTWKENKLEPTWKGPFLVLLTTETAMQTAEQGWTHHTQVKKVLPPDQKEQWAMLSYSGNTKVTLKRL